MMDDREARHALRTVARYSRHPWQAEGSALDLAEYEDAALDARVACLARDDATRGVPCSVYAAHRIRRAVTRAWLRYRTWHALRDTGRWFTAPPHAVGLRPPSPDMMAGETDAAYARTAGLTSGRWVKQQVERWRQVAYRVGLVMFHGDRDRGKTLDVSPGLRREIAVRRFSRNDTPKRARGYGDVSRPRERHQ